MEFMLSKEVISKLIDTAKQYADNSYCPYSNVAVGSSILCTDNVIFGGCNIETGDFSASSFSAGDTVIAKAISEGHNEILALCLYSKNNLVYPNATTRQYLCEFNDEVKIIIANDETYEIVENLSKIYLFAPLPLTQGDE